MNRAVSALRSRFPGTVINRLSAFRPCTALVSRFPPPTSFHNSARLQAIKKYSRPRFEGEDGFDLRPSKPKLPKAFGGSKSLHISRIPREVTDEEFRNAFASLEGLEKSELVFNSGPLRNYKGTSSRGFGFLHFTNEEHALAAARQLEEHPVRIRGEETEVNPSTASSPTLNQPSHTLYLSGLPFDLQYLEVADILRKKELGHKSIRFMAGRDREFVGAIQIAFQDTESATSARKELVGVKLGGVELRENDIKFGRPLWEYGGPTSTLMIIGVPKDGRSVSRVRDILASLEGVTRYKVVKDYHTGDYKGIAILDCVSISEAWRILEYLNKAYPSYRVAFIVDKLEHEKKLEARQPQNDEQERPTSYRRFQHE